MELLHALCFQEVFGQIVHHLNTLRRSWLNASKEWARWSSVLFLFVSFITIKRIILVKMNCVPAINWARTSLSWALTHFRFNAIWLHFVERETRNLTRKSGNQKLFYVWKILSKLRSCVGCVCSHCEVRPKQ